ncbi:MAG: hypothetical protein IH862_06705 [Chloroflexi bacterium]|nr:hypothetical protein [Chloroflexota bacterium]
MARRRRAVLWEVPAEPRGRRGRRGGRGAVLTPLVELVLDRIPRNKTSASTEAGSDSDVAADLDRYLASGDASDRDRVRLFPAAWDEACSAFGRRQV